MNNIEILENALVNQAQTSAEPSQAATSPKPTLRKDLLFLLVKIAAIALALVVLFTCVYGLTRQSDASMSPSIKDGDLVAFFRLGSSDYQAHDVVVVEFEGETQIRRIIATAGDRVDITENGLMVNGALQQEHWITQDTQRYQEGIDFPLVVPEGHVFLLGDNRSNSTDSRIYGCVDTEDILGRVMLIIRKRGI